MLDEGVGRDEGIVLARELLDQLLVLVELLQVVRRHGVDAVVLRAVDVVLVAQHADAHPGARDLREFDRAAEALVALRVVVLEPDLEFDGFEEVALLLVVRVVEQLLHVCAHSGCGEGLALGGLELGGWDEPTVIFDMVDSLPEEW